MLILMKQWMFEIRNKKFVQFNNTRVVVYDIWQLRILSAVKKKEQKNVW